jgi:hypothetical protein
MNCFEQSKFKKRKQSDLEKRKEYEKFGFKFLTKTEEMKQKKKLDKDLLNFYNKMTKKYPNLRITRSGSTQYNSFTFGTSVGEI